MVEWPWAYTALEFYADTMADRADDLGARVDAHPLLPSSPHAMLHEGRGGGARIGAASHHFFGGGRGVSVVLVVRLARADAVAAAAALRLSSTAVRALASSLGGLSGVTFANAALAAALLAA
jgi:hypothetical protein